MVTGRCKLNGKTPILVNRIQDLSNLQWHVMFKHTWREGNRCADWLASFSLNQSSYDMKMKFLDWYVKIGVASALVGASMEFFMVKTGFYDKVTVLESEKRAWENSPDAQAVREALNPWRHVDTKETNKS
ncbi:unnamed protein product [Trifolium pratense]|uniref:Uncharacterized protein n=1 Tax=Trifolium pratense TaxID=57577 RepID=A0ACB0K7L2_TRIPR|nr:unnamed protein product [Trifolium pratense]